MWQPTSFAVNFALACLSLSCWGSWGSTLKAQPERPFTLFYLSWTVGVAATAVLVFFTLGSATVLADDNGNENGFDMGPVYAALGAGAVFDAANVLLVLGIQIAGLAVAFPVGIGTALVLGTLLTYAESSDDSNSVPRPGLLFGGVGLAFLAILCQVRAKAVVDGALQPSSSSSSSSSHFSSVSSSSSSYADTEGQHSPSAFHTTARDVEKAPILPKQPADPLFLCCCCPSSPCSRRSPDSPGVGLAVCAVCGLLMSLWAPLSAVSMASPGGLTPYASFLFFALAMCVASPLICTALHRSGQHAGGGGTSDGSAGDRGLLLTFVTSPWREHYWGLLGGAVWGAGTAANLVSGSSIGLALSYAIGQAAPMVATAWGLFYYGEFDITPAAVIAANPGRTSLAGAIKFAAKKTSLSRRWVGGMFACYVAAILLIAASRQS